MKNVNPSDVTHTPYLLYTDLKMDDYLSCQSKGLDAYKPKKRERSPETNGSLLEGKRILRKEDVRLRKGSR